MGQPSNRHESRPEAPDYCKHCTAVWRGWAWDLPSCRRREEPSPTRQAGGAMSRRYRFRLYDCRLCGRCGQAGYIPAGSEEWECANDRACQRRREAKRKSAQIARDLSGEASE